MQWSKGLLLSTILTTPHLYGQDEGEANQRVRLDPAPWADARSAGLGRAVAPIANGIEAPYYNPAGIGGMENDDRPAITRLSFPFLAGALHENSIRLQQQMSQGKNIDSESMGEEILATQQGKRHYARLSIVPNIQFYRMFLAYAYDQQFAAVVRDTQGEEIDLEHRTSTGIYGGFSLATDDKSFSFGLTVGHASREVSAGVFRFEEIAAPSTRKTTFAANKDKYDGLPIHTGLMWRIDKRAWRPTLSLVARDLTGTKYRNRDRAKDDIQVEEDISLGFALSPEINNWGYSNFVIEGGQLSESGTSLAKKIRIAWEFSFGKRFGSEAPFSIQTAYTIAGLSYGFGMNAGILSLQLASYAEDVGIGNHRVIERRHVANFAVNVAAF
ncbi:MAG: hypothetical protein ACOH5I_08545 [Oligoflexus sp.]